MATNGDAFRYEDSLGPWVPEDGWKGRVDYADNGQSGPFAFRPGEVLTTQVDRALVWAQRLFPSADQQSQIAIAERTGDDDFSRMIGVPDPIALVEELAVRNIRAQPNHVFFSHCGVCCPPHPSLLSYGGYFAGPASANPASANPASANPASANPASANPASANPASANPASANPASANPASANPASANPADPTRVRGLRRSSARPAIPAGDVAQLLRDRIATPEAPNAPKVIVLDTGLPVVDPPALLSVEGIPIRPGTDGVADHPDRDRNLLLDPASGHGTFIAGIVNQVAPGCRVVVEQVLSTYGDGDEDQIAKAIERQAVDNRTILNLSFGGYVMDQPHRMANAIRQFQARGGVVVASAGNDATCQPAYPAALTGVVGVGAVGPLGPAPFTNYGPWVRACAPGVHLLSMFFEGFDGSDPDDTFKGWALWSGTSFAAPVVVGALARVMMADGCSGAEAVKRVVDAPSLMRIPNLGTVVNVI